MWLRACDASVIPVYLVLVLVHMDHNPIVVVKSSCCLLVLCDPCLHCSARLAYINSVTIMARDLIDDSFLFLLWYFVLDTGEGSFDGIDRFE